MGDVGCESGGEKNHGEGIRTMRIRKMETGKMGIGMLRCAALVGRSPPLETRSRIQGKVVKEAA